MVAAGCGLQFLQAGTLHHAFGGYVALLQEDRGWNKTELSAAAAMQQMEAAILGPILGWIMDRFGPQWVIRFGVLLFGSGFMLLSRIDTLLEFYGAFIMVALGSSLCGFFPLNVALINWFERKRARALSAMSLGMALGGMFVPVVGWSMVQYGWRATAFASGVFAILAGFPLSMVIRRRPEDQGETVDGFAHRPGTRHEPKPGKDDVDGDFTSREALRTPAFWLLSLGHGFALFVVGAVSVHAIPHMKEALGYSVSAAATIITLLTVCQIVGIVIGWTIGDRYEKRFIAAACMLMHMLGLLALTYATNLAWLVAFAALHGVGWGLRGPFMQAIRADYFGRSAIGMIMGLSLMIIVIGQIGGPMIAGMAADLTGNYRAGFTALALLAGLGSVFFVLAKRPARPLRSSS
jgi:sugar phosphate permease